MRGSFALAVDWSDKNYGRCTLEMTPLRVKAADCLYNNIAAAFAAAAD